MSRCLYRSEKSPDLGCDVEKKSSRRSNLAQELIRLDSV